MQNPFGHSWFFEKSAAAATSFFTICLSRIGQRLDGEKIWREATRCRLARKIANLNGVRTREKREKRQQNPRIVSVVVVVVNFLLFLTMCPAVIVVSTAAATTKTGIRDVTNTMAAVASSSSEEQKNVATMPNMETCTAKQLAEYLLKQRFNNDPNKTSAFLQETSKAISSVSGGTTTTAGTAELVDSSLPAIDLGEPLLGEQLETSILVPRIGKFQIQFHKNGLLAKKVSDQSISLYVPSSNVKHVVIFAKPEDIRTICNVTKSKKPKAPNAHMVLIQLSKPVPFQNKEVHTVCFALSWTKVDGPTKPKLLKEENNGASTEKEGRSSPGWEIATNEWRKSVLEHTFSNATFSQVCATPQQSQKQPFRSASDQGVSTTTANMPFVQCYHGVQDGILYPLEEGLLFFKPPKFIPRSQLASIACGRGNGGTNSSRYVDMHCELDDGEGSIEFTNIRREEIGVLNNYIHGVLVPAMHRDVANQETATSVEAVADGENQEGEGEDEGFVVAVATKDSASDTEEEEDDSDDDDDDYKEGQDDDDDDEDNENNGDEKSEDGDGTSDEDVDDDSDNDNDGGIEIVEDDFAMELAKRKKEDSATESDESDGEGMAARTKRRRRGGS